VTKNPRRGPPKASQCIVRLTDGWLSAGALAPFPFVDRVAHGLWEAVLQPRREWSIEPEVSTALRLKKPAHILRIAIGSRDRRLARDWIAMPVEDGHGTLHIEPPHASPHGDDAGIVLESFWVLDSRFEVGERPWISEARIRS